MGKKLCIYHKNCTDGFGAAWVVHHKFKDDVEFHAANYQDEGYPDVCGRDVIIVDFSYPLPVMQEIWAHAKSLVLLDHHKTAVENLGEWIEKLPAASKEHLILDMTRSGALMAWGYFFPGIHAPKVIQAISDRDTWQFKLKFTEEIHEVLGSYEQTFEIWDDLILRQRFMSLVIEGEGILRKFNREVGSLVKSLEMKLEIDGHVVPAANIPFTHASKAGHLLGKGAPFAALFSLRADGVAFSLRSEEKVGMDVSLIAKKFGGGGHKHAAGFQVSHTRFLDMMLEVLH